MQKIIVFLLFFGLCGCATTAKYEAQLNTWIGVSESALISGWGVPDKEYHTSDGKKALAFVRKSVVETGGYTYTTPVTTYHKGTVDNKEYSGTTTQYITETTPVQKHRYYCETSFILDASGKVESWHHQGNNCVAP